MKNVTNKERQNKRKRRVRLKRNDMPGVVRQWAEIRGMERRKGNEWELVASTGDKQVKIRKER